MRKFLIILFFALFLNSCIDKKCDYGCINGLCYEDNCECYTGWTGKSCDIQITPTLLKITRIDILSFPSGNYDIGSNPDIYIKIYHGEELIHTQPNYFLNANPGSTYTVNYSSNINITDPTGYYSIVLYDYDDVDSDDFIGGLQFSPYFSTNNFPNFEVVTYENFSFKVYYEYEF